MEAFLVKFTEDDKQDAEKTAIEIDTLTTDIVDQETALGVNYARLGQLGHKVRDKKYWLLWGYDNFGAYVKYLGDRVKRQRSTIYGYISAAQNLMPVIGEGAMLEIGINAASQLSRLVSVGKPITEDIIATAKTTTGTELKALVDQKLHLPVDDKGTWFQIDGFYVTEEERKEITWAMDLAASNPPIPKETPDIVRRKEIMMRWVEEFVGTYGGNDL